MLIGGYWPGNFRQRFALQFALEGSFAFLLHVLVHRLHQKHWRLHFLCRTSRTNQRYFNASRTKHILARAAIAWHFIASSSPLRTPDESAAVPRKWVNGNSRIFHQDALQLFLFWNKFSRFHTLSSLVTTTRQMRATSNFWQNLGQVATFSHDAFLRCFNVC